MLVSEGFELGRKSADEPSHIEQHTNMTLHTLPWALDVHVLPEELLNHIGLRCKKNKKETLCVNVSESQMSPQHLHNTENYILLLCRHMWGTGGAAEAQDSYV